MDHALDACFTPAAISTGAEDEPASGLTGHLNAFDIALAALAYAGPLAGTAGYTALLVSQGNGLGTPLAFFAVMVILLLFSVGYGALTRYVEAPGAFYAYITAGLGRASGLGSAFLILGAYLAIGIGCYAFTGLAAKELVDGLGGPLLPWWVYSALIWGAVATLAYFHVAVSAKVLGILLIAEILVVAWFDSATLLSGGKEGLSPVPFSWHAFSSGNVGVALLFCISLFAGFEGTAIYREETRDPARTIPRATFMVVLFIGLFYTITSYSMITGLGVSHAVELSRANPSGVFFDLAREYCGRLCYHIASILVVTSMFAADLAIQNVSTRYVFSLSVDGIFPRSLGVAHDRHRSPHRSSVTVSSAYLGLMAALTYAGFSGEQLYSWFAGVAAFGIICAMAVTSVATVCFFRRRRADDSIWQTLIAPSAAIVGLGTMVVLGFLNFPALIGGSRLLSNLMAGSCLALFLVGWLFAVWLKRTRPEVYVRIGRQ